MYIESTSHSYTSSYIHKAGAIGVRCWLLIMTSYIQLPTADGLMSEEMLSVIIHL